MELLRTLNLPDLLEKKSFFLFGPRSTGKTYLIHHQLGPKAILIDLLRSEYLLRLSNHPGELGSIVEMPEAKDKFIVIDEIQKIPQLLDEVHRLIEEKHIHFLLTGSSARKLKRGHANLLGGRAWTANLFPLTFMEIPNFDLARYLRYGGLPHVYLSQYPYEELDAYVQTYLREEILSEGLIRKLPPFSRFLKVAALSSGTQINLTKLGSDCQVAPSTVSEYFTILEDTLVGFFLEPWTKSQKRKPSMTKKFYLFDPGVTHMLSGTKELDRNSNLYGMSFEQFIAMELRAFLSYKRLQEPLTFWRTLNGYEVDLLIGDQIAIEVKATTRVSKSDLQGLKVLSEEGIFKKFYMVSEDRFEAQKDGITMLNWRSFLTQLWNNQILPLSTPH